MNLGAIIERLYRKYQFGHMHIRMSWECSALINQ
jgi:hypothetical protein